MRVEIGYDPTNPYYSVFVFHQIGNDKYNNFYITDEGVIKSQIVNIGDNMKPFMKMDFLLFKEFSQCFCQKIIDMGFYNSSIESKTKEAIENHLVDMQTIAFHLLKINKK